MRKGLTELVFILDRSGSMHGMESDTIGGFNSMIAKQRKLEGRAYVSTVLFDNESVVLHDRVGLHKIQPMRFGKGFLKVAAEVRAIDDNELTLLTVSECKGLEFDTVYVFSDGMTENEKYVAYTRALDHLSVITDENLSQIKISEEERIKQEKAKRKKEEAPAPDVALPVEEVRTPDSKPEESEQPQEKVELAEEPVTSD